MNSGISNLLQGIKSWVITKLSNNYYTKTEVDSLFGGITNLSFDSSSKKLSFSISGKTYYITVSE